MSEISVAEETLPFPKEKLCRDCETSMELVFHGTKHVGYRCRECTLRDRAAN